MDKIVEKPWYKKWRSIPIWIIVGFMVLPFVFMAIPAILIWRSQKLNKKIKYPVVGGLLFLGIFFTILFYKNLSEENTQKEITKPEVTALATVKPKQAGETPKEIIGYLDDGSNTALFTYGIDPLEHEKQLNEAIFSGNADKVIELSEKYILQTPKRTKILILGEEISIPPDPLLGRNKTLVDVKIKILDEVHKGKVGWANKEHIKFDNTKSTKTPTSTTVSTRTPAPTPIQQSQTWQTVQKLSGSGNKEFNPVDTTTGNWIIKWSYSGGTISYDDNLEQLEPYGIWVCQNEGSISSCGFESPSFHTCDTSCSTSMDLNSYRSKVVVVKVRAGTNTTWTAEIQQLK